MVRNYKFGVLFCKEGQTTENEWFGNGLKISLLKWNLNLFLFKEHGSDEFNEFLDVIGDRINLQGWNKFRGGLDVNGLFLFLFFFYLKRKTN